MQELKVKDQEKIMREYRRSKHGKKGKIQGMIDRFLKSTDTVMEIKPDAGEYQDIKNLQTAICKVITKSGHDLHTFKKDGHLYILKGVYL